MLTHTRSHGIGRTMTIAKIKMCLNTFRVQTNNQDHLSGSSVFNCFLVHEHLIYYSTVLLRLDATRRAPAIHVKLNVYF